ncbi:hypothetical protein N657DRAFT_662839 [Parathielavia appendiculata]|uniref:protein-ribulosamine 3-kinase n=1 Tax=Parathielavia appendiculata TaxID=2587402 RepID=A0AAN6Z4Y8_9PEZI|nr:hypothetical protein N657DRAFT_662839 [Parathielavia appendiculata]
MISALPYPDSKVLSTNNYGMSLWGQTGKITAELPDGTTKHYFLTTANLGDTGHAMILGEYESLKAIHAVSPNIRLADMHKKSQSPTGKFGFHVTTCHAKLRQMTDCWEDSWAALCRKQLAHMIELEEVKHGEWPEFKIVCQLILDKVIPRLLEPLQSNGRSIKPCLVHGDLWDENTATDMATGEPFIFDAGSFYAHNEYEIRGSGMTENLLYSLRFDLGTAILIPCNQRQIVKENMIILCKKVFPNELACFAEKPG